MTRRIYSNWGLYKKEEAAAHSDPIFQAEAPEQNITTLEIPEEYLKQQNISDTTSAYDQVDAPAQAVQEDIGVEEPEVKLPQELPVQNNATLEKELPTRDTLVKLFKIYQAIKDHDIK